MILVDEADPAGGVVRYRRVPHCVFRWLRSRVLVTVPDAPFHVLEGSAAVVFALLTGPSTLDELAARIAADQPDGTGPGTDGGVDIDAVRARVVDAVGHLVGAGLVETV